MTVSSFASPWVEGTANNYEPQTGSSCFNWQQYPDVPWTVRGSDLTAVMLGNGNTIWRMADATPPDAEGWQTVPVDPDVVAAPSGRLELRILAIRRHGLGMDSPGRAVRAASVSEPIRLQQPAECEFRALLDCLSGRGEPPAARSGNAIGRGQRAHGPASCRRSVDHMELAERRSERRKLRRPWIFGFRSAAIGRAIHGRAAIFDSACRKTGRKSRDASARLW